MSTRIDVFPACDCVEWLNDPRNGLQPQTSLVGPLATAICNIVKALWNRLPSLNLIPGAAAQEITDPTDSNLSLQRSFTYNMTSQLANDADDRFEQVQSDIAGIKETLSTQKAAANTQCTANAGSTVEYDVLCGIVKSGLDGIEFLLDEMVDEATSSHGKVNAAFHSAVSMDEMSGSLVGSLNTYVATMQSNLNACSVMADPTTSLASLNNAAETLLAAVRLANEGEENALFRELNVVDGLINPLEQNVTAAGVAMSQYFQMNTGSQQTPFFQLRSDSSGWYNALLTALGDLDTKMSMLRSSIPAVYDTYIDGDAGSYILELNQTMADARALCVQLSMEMTSPNTVTTTELIEAMTTLASSLETTKATVVAATTVAATTVAGTTVAGTTPSAVKPVDPVEPEVAPSGGLTVPIEAVGGALAACCFIVALLGIVVVVRQKKSKSADPESAKPQPPAQPTYSEYGQLVLKDPGASSASLPPSPAQYDVVVYPEGEGPTQVGGGVYEVAGASFEVAGPAYDSHAAQLDSSAGDGEYGRVGVPATNLYTPGPLVNKGVGVDGYAPMPEGPRVNGSAVAVVVAAEGEEGTVPATDTYDHMPVAPDSAASDVYGSAPALQE